MKKTVFSSIITACILLLLSFSCSAEEYIFTVNESFPMPYSTSITTVNANHGVYTASSLEDIQYLIDEGLVDYCEPMSYSELFDYTTNDTYYTDQTNLTQVLAQFAWNKGVFGESANGEKVKIAIIDSGLYNAAADFNFDNIYKVADYTSTASSKVSFCDDEIGHGTMVTGIIAAEHNTRGVAGIAPNVEIYVFKCFYLDENGRQKAKNSDILAAAYEAIDTYGVDIINLSSGTTNATVFKAVADYAEEKNVLIVSAVGNSGAQSGDTIYYPASYDNVIGVGSVAANGHRASHSQRNDYVDMMAPGESIYSVRISGYEKGSGTSFATPHVVAAAALAKSLNPELSVQELTEALYKSCNAMTDRYSGHGSLNIQALLTYVQATLNPDKLIYSSSDTSSYVYCFSTEGYTTYFARYEGDMLVDIKKDVNTLTGDFNSYIYYIWKKDTLEPYDGDIIAEEY
ncbi:MAG: S8 family serine peptidase [Clostridia bacterium]|nr:S8 family serine peptidase [Clostridia bacterium]